MLILYGLNMNYTFFILNRWLVLFVGAFLFPGNLWSQEELSGPEFESCEVEAYTNDISAEDYAFSYTGAVVYFESGLVVFQGGEAIFEKDELPVLGVATASHVIAGVFDYTCGHCRAMTRDIAGIQQGYGDDLAVFMLPGTRKGDSEAIQLLMLVVWKNDRVFYEKLSRNLYYEAVPATIKKVTEIVKTVWGKDLLKERMRRDHDWAIDVIFRSVDVVRANMKLGHSTKVPQLMLGTHIHVGSPPALEVYYDLLQEHFGLKQRLPVLQDIGEVIEIGKVFSGVSINLEIPLPNKGNAPLILGKLVLPPGSSIQKYPQDPIAPGKMEILEILFPIPFTGGPFEKRMVLVCNTVPKERQLTIKGEAWNPLRMEPPSIDLSAATALPTTRKIIIYSTDSVALGTPNLTHDFLEATLTPNEDNTRYEVEVTLKGLVNVDGDAFVYIPIVEKPTPEHPWPGSIQIPVNLN